MSAWQSEAYYQGGGWGYDVVWDSHLNPEPPIAPEILDVVPEDD